jgi:phosphoglycerol transferase MdoB-like AlkP superfamily enzyme
MIADPRVALPLAAVAVLVLAAGEQDLGTVPFLLATCVALFALAFASTSRFATSLSATLTALLTICAISHMKLEFMGMSIYAYDAYFYSSDLDIYRFLWDTYLDPVWLALGVAGVGTALTLGLLFVEARRVRAQRSALIVSLVAWPALVVTYPQAAYHTSFYLHGHRTTSLFTSLFSASAVASDMSLYRGFKPDPNAGVYDPHVRCGSPDKRPDIVVTLMESAMPPALYHLKAGPALREAFSSGDVRPLRVETFGGGTWISSIGFMTSVATKDFGWARPYLPVFLKGRVHHSLPQLLEQCGYRTALISPLTYNFVNEGAFMTSIGIDDYLDFNALHAPSKHERDAFYFNAALRYLADRHKTSAAPVFLFVMTMAPHGPYRDKFLPDVTVNGAPFGNEAQVDEYLRRLSMQQADYRAFVRTLDGAAGSKRGTVLLDFGDHQPAPQPPLVPDLSTALPDWNSRAYETYYRLSAVGYRLASPAPAFPALDIAYLAPTLLQSAGLPLDAYYDDLLALRDRCNGVYSLCSDSGVAIHRSRTLNSHFLDLRSLVVSQKSH